MQANQGSRAMGALLVLTAVAVRPDLPWGDPLRRECCSSAVPACWLNDAGGVRGEGRMQSGVSVRL